MRDEEKISRKLSNLVDSALNAGRSHPADRLVELRRRHRQRSLLRVFALVAGVAILSGTAVVLSQSLGETSGPVAAGRGIATPPPETCADAMEVEHSAISTECSPAVVETNQSSSEEFSSDPIVINVYLLAEDSDPYAKASYAPSPRTTEGELTPDGMLRAALSELVRGTTPEEEEQGFASIFTTRTAEILRHVTLKDGRAIVNFTDFRDLIPAASSSEGGTVFTRQLNHTVFQFPEVESVEYRLDGDCATFWEFLEAGSQCIVIDRAQWMNSP